MILRKKSVRRELTSSDFMTPEQVSLAIGFRVGTLANWRSQRKGPPYCKTPRIFYERESLYRWMRDREVRPEE